MLERYDRDSEGFVSYLTSHGISYDQICKEGLHTQLPRGDLSAAQMDEAKGVLAAVSLRCVQIFESLLPAEHKTLAQDDRLSALTYLLPHKNPHIDEYFSGLLFRASLPPDKQDLVMGETLIASITDDQAAKDLWPQAAVLGIGSRLAGGASALFLYDEHPTDNRSQSGSNSLALLMRNELLPEGTLSVALEKVINEIDHIDSFGGGHLKNLSLYCKLLHEARLRVVNSEKTREDTAEATVTSANTTGKWVEMDPTWKTALMDVALVTFLLELNSRNLSMENGFFSIPSKDYLPALLSVIDDYKKTSTFRTNPTFLAALAKIRELFKKTFPRDQEAKKIVLTKQSSAAERTVQKDAGGRPISQILLVPYLPFLLEKYWGKEAARIFFFPLLEARINRELTNMELSTELRDRINPPTENYHELSLSFGVANVLHGISQDNTAYSVLEISTDLGEIFPGTLLHFFRNCSDGRGCILLHNQKFKTTFLGKGVMLSQSVWSRLCEEIIQLEGESLPTPEGCGCWHIIRHDQLVAPFLLNRNPAHQYVPETSLNAQKLFELLTHAMKEPEVVATPTHAPKQTSMELSIEALNFYKKPKNETASKKRPKKADVERALSHAARKMLLGADKEILTKFVQNLEETDADYPQWKTLYEKAQSVIRSW
jgi:hypothetical protein